MDQGFSPNNQDNKFSSDNSFSIQFKNFWAKPIGKIVIIGVPMIIILSFIFVVYFLYKIGEKSLDIASSPTPSVLNNQTAANVTSNPEKLLDMATTVKMVQKSAGYCKALAPENWAIIADPNGRGTDLMNPELTQAAGWMITPVVSALYGEPDTAIPTLMGLIGNSNYTFTNSGEQIDGGFTMRNFTATISGKNVKGVALYKKYPVDDSAYVLSYYSGVATADIWDQVGAIPMSVAISIRCTAQYRPSTSDGFSSDSSSSIGDSGDKLSVSEKWQEGMMGYENVYSPTTGEHYEAPLSSYNETGSDGPGYYRSVPNGTEKLERGFGNY